MPKRKDLPRSFEGRPQAPPPALMQGDEGIPGNSILDEVKGAAGIVLWQSLRDAVLWAHTPPPGKNLFAPGRERARLARIVAHGVDPEITRALATIARVLGSNPPSERREVAAACRSISQWADGRGLLRTALAFAQGAAIVAPDDAAAAYRVGWLARRRAEYDRAETWFRRAVGLARRSGDRHAFAMAHIGLGNLHMQKREFAEAREPLLRAYRTARRASSRQAKAMALHDLFCVSAYFGEVSEAHAYGRAAFRAYGPRHSRLPQLAQDIARFWMLQGYCAPALSVFRAMLRHMTAPADHILTESNIARAAGGTGDLLVFVDAWTEVWRLIDIHEEAHSTPEALLNLAHGALSLGDYERAELASGSAIRVSEARREDNVRAMAESILHLASIRQRPERCAGDSARTADSELVDGLAKDLVSALTASAPVQ